MTASAAFWYPLLDRDHGVVLAAWAFYNWQFGDVPFFALDQIAFTTRPEDRRGLGGFQTLRGFAMNRFLGKVSATAHLETRWTVGEAVVWSQHLRFQIAPFIDTGRVFDSPAATSLRNWEFGYGAGLRLAWNLSTIVSFDYATTREGAAFYMELGHQF